MRDQRYDVFISYNSNEHEWAVQLANELEGLQLDVWIDKRVLTPGRRWQDQLSRGLHKSRSMAFLFGPSGLGPWHRRELQLVLSEHADEDYSVVPILLPGADVRKLPDFLKQYHRIDHRDNGVSQKCLEQLVRGITGRKITRSVDQIAEEFPLRLRKPAPLAKTIAVCTLPNPHPDRLLYLTWETFGRGIEILKTQIRNQGRRLPVDACFGINEAGLVIATFLSSSTLGRKKLGYVKCEGTQEGTRVLSDSLFPRLPHEATILLCDFEVKRSNVLKIIVERIRKHYTNHVLRFYFAVFGAMTNVPDLRISSYTKLVSARNMATLDLEDVFIACTMHHPGIEPPLELR